MAPRPTRWHPLLSQCAGMRVDDLSALPASGAPAQQDLRLPMKEAPNSSPSAARPLPRGWLPYFSGSVPVMPGAYPADGRAAAQSGTLLRRRPASAWSASAEPSAAAGPPPRSSTSTPCTASSTCLPGSPPSPGQPSLLLAYHLVDGSKTGRTGRFAHRLPAAGHDPKRSSRIVSRRPCDGLTPVPVTRRTRVRRRRARGTFGPPPQRGKSPAGRAEPVAQPLVTAPGDVSDQAGGRAQPGRKVAEQ